MPLFSDSKRQRCASSCLNITLIWIRLRNVKWRLLRFWGLLLSVVNTKNRSLLYTVKTCHCKCSQDILVAAAWYLRFNHLYQSSCSLHFESSFSWAWNLCVACKLWDLSQLEIVDVHLVWFSSKCVWPHHYYYYSLFVLLSREGRALLANKCVKVPCYCNTAINAHVCIHIRSPMIHTTFTAEFNITSASASFSSLQLYSVLKTAVRHRQHGQTHYFKTKSRAWLRRATVEEIRMFHITAWPRASGRLYI